MKLSGIPITDDHIHIDPANGRGIEAAKDFRRSGGTHIFLVSKPSWSFGSSQPPAKTTGGPLIQPSGWPGWSGRPGLWSIRSSASTRQR